MTAPAVTLATVQPLASKLGPLLSFPWHRQQRVALAQATDTIVILGGTQGGKSSAGMGILARVMRREGPIYRRLQAAHRKHPTVIIDPDTRALKLWVAPKTGEKALSVWEPLLREQAFGGLPYDYVQSPHRVFTWADGVSRENTLWLKCLPEWEVVRMADGTQKPIGDVAVGDWVLGFDPQSRRASPARVTATTRTGRRQVSRLTCRDGTTLHATPEHRVLIQRAVCGRPRLAQYPVAALPSLAGHPGLVTAQVREYTPAPALPLPPYLVGALLGDGSLPRTGVVLTSADAAVVERCAVDLRTLGYRWTALRSQYGYCAVEMIRRPGRRPPGALIAGLAALGLLDTGVRTKFIPEIYLRASHADRLLLLAGLIDTDGTARRFTSCSQALADGFATLTRSIGGSALVRYRPRRCTNSATPERIIDSWDVEYNVNGVRVPVVLPRKQKMTSSRGRETTVRRIVRHEDVGMHPCVDIAIDHPSHLFLAGTADVAVHNSQDQGLLAFESDAVDLVLFDEEPLDRRLVGAARGRTTTTNGVIVLAFTPLHGLTWTHGAYYVPICRPEYQLADRVWRDGSRLALIQMGMADNPAAVAGGGVQRLRDDPTITEAERNTRLYGSYGYAEGLIFPVLAGLFTDQPDSLYLLDGLPKGRAYSWVLTCDPNKRHGGLLTALDEEGNRYAVAEHYAENLPDREHVARYRALLAALGLEEGTVPTYADPGGAGAQAILNLADLDFYAEAVPKGPGSVKASIEMVRRALWPNPTHRHPVTGRMGAPALYFLRSLRSQWTTDGVDYDESRLLWELRQYRQKEGAPPDTPVKALDDVSDCLSYSYLVRPYVPGEAAAKWGLPPAPTRELDRMSQLAVTDYERTVTKIAKQNRRGR